MKMTLVDDTHATQDTNFWRKRRMQEFCQPVNRGIKESTEDYKLI